MAGALSNAPVGWQVALAIFKLCEQKLMASEDMGAAIHVLRDFELGLYNSDGLLECATLEFATVGEMAREGVQV